jgi:hypothetical protein
MSKMWSAYVITTTTNGRWVRTSADTEEEANTNVLEHAAMFENELPMGEVTHKHEISVMADEVMPDATVN